MKATIVEPEDVPYIWDNVAPLLSKVIQHSEGELETDDYLSNLMSGSMQLWIVTEDGKIILSMVTQIIQFPQKKVLRTIALAGERFKEVHSQFSDMLASYALKNKCSSLELWGRKGWKKMLPDWKDTYIVYTKDLKERMH
jgi:thioester reductase-like protein